MLDRSITIIPYFAGTPSQVLRDMRREKIDLMKGRNNKQKGVEDAQKCRNLTSFVYKCPRYRG